MIDWNGYADCFSDWQGKQCDYATNKTVHDYYNDDAKWFRVTAKNDLQSLNQDLAEGKRVIVGIDYYALYSISGPLIPSDLIKKIAPELMSGKVFLFELYADGDKIYWKGIP